MNINGSHGLCLRHGDLIIVVDIDRRFESQQLLFKVGIGKLHDQFAGSCLYSHGTLGPGRLAIDLRRGHNVGCSCNDSFHLTVGHLGNIGIFRCPSDSCTIGSTTHSNIA